MSPPYNLLRKQTGHWPREGSIVWLILCLLNLVTVLSKGFCQPDLTAVHLSAWFFQASLGRQQVGRAVPSVLRQLSVHPCGHLQWFEPSSTSKLRLDLAIGNRSLYLTSVTGSSHQSLSHSWSDFFLIYLLSCSYFLMSFENKEGKGQKQNNVWREEAKDWNGKGKKK